MDASLLTRIVDLVGFLAAAFTILAYAQRVAVPLRCFGLAANACFIAYGSARSLAPVVLLHLVLLALNLHRLRGALHARPARGAGAAAGAFVAFPARAPVGPA